MATAKIPETDAVLLIRALGLLFNQAGVYGPQHNVTQGSARSVFAELEQALNNFGPIEFTERAGQILVNGSSNGISAVAGKNLADRMVQYKVGGLLFTPALDQREFLTCLNILSTPPSRIAEQGGCEAALKQAGVRGLRVVSVSYQRVSEEGVATPPVAPAPVPVAAAPRAAEPARLSRLPGVLDLSAALADAEPSQGLSRDTAPQDEDPGAAARRKRAASLAAMMRRAAEELERGAEQGIAASRQEVVGVLEQLRDTLSEMETGSRSGISMLAREVEEDSKTIASIESAARRRGIGLKLTRGELLQRYAELNQEISQPLTVSTGAIDMLNSGCAGNLTEAQRELLKLAAESVERVNQLVAFMNRISGLPDTYTPDGALIADSYR